MAGKIAHALELGALMLLAAWLAGSIVSEADFGASIWPWHRMTSDEAYRLGTLGRYAFVAQRPLVFHHDPYGPSDSDAFGAPPLEGVTVAAFTADGGVDGTSAITFFGNVTDPSAEVVAHEYGHALLWDYLGTPRANGDHQLGVAFAFRALSDFVPGSRLDPRVASDGPEFLPLLSEYRHDPSAFGGYASQTFGEWFAQANYYYLYGKPVPPRTRAFLQHLDAMR